MRLPKVENGQAPGRKAIYWLIRLVMRREPYDVVKLVGYRPSFFGTHMVRLAQAVMRGPSQWSVGERELFAAFVSRLNECRF